MSLAKPAFYFPIERPLYEVSAGLKPLGFDFGNKDLDQKIFQIDENFEKYRHNKIECRKENLSKYFTQFDLSPNYIYALAKFIIERLTFEYPEIFILHNTTLIAHHTQDEIIFDKNYHLVEFKSAQNINPKPTHILDALALQFAEDFALLCRRSDRSDFLSMIHLCSASHWAAEDKIGKPFVYVHSPIPHIEKINKTSENMIEAMINKGPFVRFVWSFVTDTRLNHHPIAPTGIDQKIWKGRSFNSDLEIPFYLRVERQIVHGLPQIDSSFFGIGISFIDGLTIKASEHMRTNLIGALKSMSPESKVYKGVDQCFTELISWLES